MFNVQQDTRDVVQSFGKGFVSATTTGKCCKLFAALTAFVNNWRLLCVFRPFLISAQLQATT